MNEKIEPYTPEEPWIVTCDKLWRRVNNWGGEELSSACQACVWDVRGNCDWLFDPENKWKVKPWETREVSFANMFWWTMPQGPKRRS